MSEWKNADGSTSVGCKEDFKGNSPKSAPKEEKADKPKKATKKK